MCTTDKRKWNGARCALLFHSEEFFGLARSDYNTVHGKEVSAWKPPNKQTIERNERHIKNFQNVIKDGSIGGIRYVMKRSDGNMNEKAKIYVRCGVNIMHRGIVHK